MYKSQFSEICKENAEISIMSQTYTTTLVILAKFQ